LWLCCHALVAADLCSRFSKQSQQQFSSLSSLLTVHLQVCTPISILQLYPLVRLIRFRYQLRFSLLQMYPYTPDSFAQAGSALCIEQLNLNPSVTLLSIFFSQHRFVRRVPVGATLSKDLFTSKLFMSEELLTSWLHSLTFFAPPPLPIAQSCTCTCRFNFRAEHLNPFRRLSSLFLLLYHVSSTCSHIVFFIFTITSGHSTCKSHRGALRAM
jgi:hypothetical protein